MILVLKATSKKASEPWILEAQNGEVKIQVRGKGDTYMAIEIKNEWRQYEIRIEPPDIKEIQAACSKFVKDLKEQGWDL